MRLVEEVGQLAEVQLVEMAPVLLLAAGIVQGPAVRIKKQRRIGQLEQQAEVQQGLVLEERQELLEGQVVQALALVAWV